jgi:hypothetical protein
MADVLRRTVLYDVCWYSMTCQFQISVMTKRLLLLARLNISFWRHLFICSLMLLCLLLLPLPRLPNIDNFIHLTCLEKEVELLQSLFGKSRRRQGLNYFWQSTTT